MADCFLKLSFSAEVFDGHSIYVRIITGLVQLTCVLPALGKPAISTSSHVYRPPSKTRSRLQKERNIWTTLQQSHNCYAEKLPNENIIM